MAVVNKYQNGKIYAIRSPSSDKIYIGSTCDSLAKRIYGHRNAHKRFKAGKYPNVTSFEILDFGDEYIELLEACPCNNKNELNRREGQIIRVTVLAVNRKIEGRTPKEYNKEYATINAVAIAAHKKEYRVENAVAIAAQQNEKHACICGGRYTTSGKSQHHKSKLHTNYIAAAPALPVEPVAA